MANNNKIKDDELNHSRRLRKEKLARKLRIEKFLIIVGLVFCMILTGVILKVNRLSAKNDPKAGPSSQAAGVKSGSAEKLSVGEEEEDTESEADVSSSVSLTEQTAEETVPVEPTPVPVVTEVPQPEIDPRADGIQVGISYISELAGDGTLTKDQSLYYDAVVEAGGEPVFLPLVTDIESAREALSQVDCVVMAGGMDIDPAMYGEEAQDTYQHNFFYSRDISDYWMIQEAIVEDKPMLAICRGMQMMNIVLGGTLIQDIPSEIGLQVIHQNETGAEYHYITIEDGSKLASIMGDTYIRVNSYHHQCLEIVPDVLEVTARSEDGVIEAVEMPDSCGKKFVMGVQFHPEWMVRLGEYQFLPLFSAMMDAV